MVAMVGGKFSVHGIEDSTTASSAPGTGTLVGRLRLVQTFIVDS